MQPLYFFVIRRFCEREADQTSFDALKVTSSHVHTLMKVSTSELETHASCITVTHIESFLY